MDRVGMATLSDQFRAYAQTLSGFALAQLESTMQTTFGLKNLRNVQLWTRPGATTRNFINPRVGTLDLDMRIAFAQGILESRTPSFPTKITQFEDFPDKNGLKLREYLSNNYTRSAMARILINPDGSVAFEYDVYGSGFVDEIVDEDDLEEFR